MLDFRTQVLLDMQGVDHDVKRAITTGFEERNMADPVTREIMMAGMHKIKEVRVFQKGVEGSPLLFEDVDSWRVGYNGILVIKGENYIDVLSQDCWNRIIVNEE